MSWIKDIFDPQKRLWEDFYRSRWQYDKKVRSTHGVNCTGGCSWQVYVKDGIITWELQETDYPPLEPHLPHYEPRGCQRGITFSWYIYSPLRIRHPYIRGALLDLWRLARARYPDPVEAWQSIVENEEERRNYQRARGKGGLRRLPWDTAVEIVTASMIYTSKKYGPDRVVGFTPIPAMSMISYASGTRFLSLFGGVALSFYDWYADLPPASPEVWGEKTDVAESADWYNSKYIVVMGSNLNMTRTPDVHFVAEARTNGSKLVVLSPDFSQVSKYADWWLPVRAGHDGAFWLAVDHVILREFHIDRQVPYFVDYLKRYSDSPFLVGLERRDDGTFTEGRLVRAGTMERYADQENAEWKFLVYDTQTKAPRMPSGSVGFRWQKEKGKWNLDMKDGSDGSDISPALSLIEDRDGAVQISFEEFGSGKTIRRGVPIKKIKTVHGEIMAATVFDLLLARMGIQQGLEGEYPGDYNDPDAPYTPAWQERHTGIGRNTVIRFAREWAATAERTRGKCTIIVGSGTNHWYHSNLNYRAGITALILCGCVGVNGGGLNHYTGQEKIAPEASWKDLAFATDWTKPPRLQNAPSFHYIHTDQWRYSAPLIAPKILGHEHPADMQVDAVRMGWLPFYPQFDRNTIDLVRQAEAAGAKTDEEIIAWLVRQLKEKNVRFAVEDPDAPGNWPRVWLIWRGNAMHASMKGHEYLLRHYLGTTSNAVADEVVTGSIKEMHSDAPAPEGKLDLVVDINFRMDTSALFSDIILPAATWYEKEDINTTDLHSYIHPFSAAVPPCWESKNDWEIFKAIAAKTAELARVHFPEPFREIVATPLMHDTPQEIAQPLVRNWRRNECEAVPGRTMPELTVVTRDLPNIYRRFTSFGARQKEGGMEERGIHWPVADLYDEIVRRGPVEEWGGKKYPSIAESKDAANVILHFAPESNGESAYRGFRSLEEITGKKLCDLAEEHRDARTMLTDLIEQPRRILTSPCWSGITNDGRAYSPYCINIERLVPWRTLTGRQHFYMDHEGYLSYGESLPTFKPKIDLAHSGDLRRSSGSGKTLVINSLTPHGKWHIHTTYYDNLIMLTLSRGAEPFWLNSADAAEIGIADNDWVEVFNDNGVVVTRAAVSARIPRGLGIFYHAPERTIAFPKSPERKMKRGGGTNSLTRIRLKPVLMVGGYGQFSYAFNYWGPPGPDRDTYAYVRKLEGKPVFK